MRCGKADQPHTPGVPELTFCNDYQPRAQLPGWWGACVAVSLFPRLTQGQKT